MKKITDKEYKLFEEYKSALRSGQLLTPSGLNTICESFNYDPEKIGKHFIECNIRFKQKNNGHLGG